MDDDIYGDLFDAPASDMQGAPHNPCISISTFQTSTVVAQPQMTMTQVFHDHDLTEVRAALHKCSCNLELPVDYLLNESMNYGRLSIDLSI